MLLVAVVQTLMAWVAPAFAADRTSLWDGSTGDWTDAARWSTNPDYPDNNRDGTTYDAVISGGSVTVNNYALTIDRLTLSNATISTNGLFLKTGWVASGSNTRLAGSIRVDESYGVTNSGTLDLQGPTSVDPLNNTGVYPAFINTGTVVKSAGDPGYSSTFYTHFTNSGTVEARAGTLSFPVSYTQTAGETRLSGGFLQVDKSFNLAGGKLTGAGRVQALATVSGSVSIEPSSVDTLEVWQGVTVDAPGSGAQAILNGGHLVVGQPDYIGGYKDLTLGFTGRGDFTQTAGTNEVLGSLQIGYAATASGTYMINAGTLKVGVDETVGGAGTGAAVLISGEQDVSGNLRIGVEANGTGSFELRNGALKVGSETIPGSGKVAVGVAGTGTFRQTGGTHDLQGDLVLGELPSGKGTYTLDNNAKLTSLGSAVVGAGGTGFFFHLSGTHIPQKLVVAGEAGSVGSYIQLSGLTSAPGGIEVGSSGDGRLGQLGGEVSAYKQKVSVGTNSGGVGLYTLAGAPDTTLGADPLVVGDYGQGTLTQSGGQVVAGNLGTGVLTGTVFVGAQAGGQGTYNIQGGEVKALYMTVGSHGAGTVTQTGGTVTLVVNPARDDPQGAELVVGDSPTTTALYHMIGGRLDVQKEYVGKGPIVPNIPTGVFRQEGGLHTVGALGLLVGYSQGSFGRYELAITSPDTRV